MNLSFLPLADAELREAAHYYESQRSGLGLSFSAAVHNAVSSVSANPEAARPVGGGIRSKSVKRFPYSVLYAVEEGQILIIAIAHHKRRPGYWRRRLQDR